MKLPKVRVSAGILLKENKVLLTLRSEKQFIPFVWQFPGGKANKGEASIQALRRELKEELNIEVQAARLIAIQIYQFAPTQEWIIYFYLIDKFEGNIIAAENQTLHWTNIYDFDDLSIIKPNKKIMDTLRTMNTESKNNFVWEDVWALDTKEFSSHQTRIRRGAVKVSTLQNIGLQIQEGERIVDLGSGTGEVSFFLKEIFHDIQYETICVEMSPNAVQKLLSRLPDDSSIEAIEGDVCSIPVPSGFFDKALGISIIEHIQPVELFLAEVHRVLKPNGEFFISQSNTLSAHHADWHIRKFLNRWPYGYQKYYTLSELEKLLQPWFALEETKIVLPDTDAPIHRFLDKTINNVMPNWGRNMFIRTRRK